MDDEVRVAADRRGEVRVRAAREPGVAEVARVVARLLERAQHERGERLLPAPRLLAVARRRPRRPSAASSAAPLGVSSSIFGAGGVGTSSAASFCEQERDRLRVRPLVHAEERLRAPRREQLADALVGEDHQLLDERVRERLRLEPRVRDPALAVEGEDDLRRLDPQRAAREAPPTQLRRELLAEAQRLEHRLVDRLLPREDPLRLPVAEPRVGADHRAVEARLARLEPGPERDLDRHAQPLDLRPQRARVVGELVRQHRRDPARDVHREAALGRAVVERLAGADVRGDVRDVHPRAQPVALAAEGERVVEVLRRLRVDRERDEVARSTRSSRGGSRELERLGGRFAPLATSQPSSAASIELAGPSTRSTCGRPRPSATTTRSPGRASCAPERSSTNGAPAAKNGSPKTSFAASRDLRDDELGQTCRNFRSVRPAPPAPSTSPTASRMSAVQPERHRVHARVAVRSGSDRRRVTFASSRSSTATAIRRAPRAAPRS